MLLNCGAGEDSWESLGQQVDQPVSPKGDQPWVFIGSTDTKVPILWPPDAMNRLPWYWERLRAREEGADRGWDGCMALLTQWTWV